MTFGCGTRAAFIFLFMLGRPVQVARRCRGLLMLSLTCSLTLWGWAHTTCPTSAGSSFTFCSYSWAKCLFSSMKDASFSSSLLPSLKWVAWRWGETSVCSSLMTTWIPAHLRRIQFIFASPASRPSSLLNSLPCRPQLPDSTQKEHPPVDCLSTLQLQKAKSL